MSESLVGNLLVASTVAPPSVFSQSVCLVVHQDPDAIVGVMLNRPIAVPPDELLHQWLGGPKPPSEGKTPLPNQLAAGDASGQPGLGEHLSSIQAPGGQAAGGQAAGGQLPVGQVGESGQIGQAIGGKSIGGGGGGARIHFGGPLSGPLLALHGEPQAAESEAGPGVYVAAQQQHLRQLVQQHDSDFRLIIGHSGWSTRQLRDELLAGYWHVLPATRENTLPVHDDLWPRLLRRAAGVSLASWVGAADSGGQVGLN